MSVGGTPYNLYEAFINAAVGAGIYAFNHGTKHTRGLLEFALEKAVINGIASAVSYYTNIGTGDPEQMDVEYLTSAILAGMYHSHVPMSAAGEQFLVSVLSHILTSKSATKGKQWFDWNAYGTTGTAPAANNP
jgi:hypothetical protein